MMKRLILTTLLSAFLGAGLWAQTPFFTENFSSSSLPAGWQNVDNTGNNAGTWTRKTTNPYAFASTTVTNGFMVFDAEDFGNDGKAENADLITRAIDCSAHSRVALQFEQYFYQFQYAQGTVSVSTDGISWSDVYTVNQNTSSDDIVTIDLTGIAANKPSVFVKFNYTGNWDYFWAIDDIKLFEPPALDISVESITSDSYVKIGNQTVSGTVKNNGTNTIHSFDLVYTTSTGDTVAESFSGVNINAFETYNFQFAHLLQLPAPTQCTINITALAPNNGSESNLTNNTATKTIVALSAIPDKTVLIEEFTTAVCVYCPIGTSYMKRILANHNNIIGVELHAGFGTDAMTIPEHSTVAQAYTDGAPTAEIDRVLFAGEPQVATSYNVWETYGVQQGNTIPPVALVADNTYDYNTRELTVNASARFFGPISGDFRINCYIVEDSVSGTGSGYNQQNALNNDNTSEWYHKGNPIIGFKHRHVCREMLGGAWGTANVIANPTEDNTLYTKQYTYTLPSTWKTDQITLVVLVQEYNANPNKRPILNALEIGLNSADSTHVTQAEISNIKDIPSALSQVSLYPNPTTDLLHITYSVQKNTAISFEVLNIVGQRVSSVNSGTLGQGNYSTQLNTANFENGVYFLTIRENGRTTKTLKFVVTR